MSKLVIQLPATLQRQLEQLAEGEGVSLNQYIIYALTRQITLAYQVKALSQEEISQQEQSFQALLQDMGKASLEEIEAVLLQREVVQPDASYCIAFQHNATVWYKHDTIPP